MFAAFWIAPIITCAIRRTRRARFSSSA
jgi:hypothetical protein